MALPSMLIVLNGPPGCGKDAIAIGIQNYLVDNGFATSVLHLKFAEPLREHLKYLCPESADDAWFAANKDSYIIPRTKRTPREEMIHRFVSVADTRGPSWLGFEFVKNLNAIAEAPEKAYSDIVIVGDCGRWSDLEPVVKDLKIATYVCRIRREGFTFEGDVREYIFATRDVTADPLIRARYFEKDIINSEGKLGECVKDIERFLFNPLRQDGIRGGGGDDGSDK